MSKFTLPLPAHPSLEQLQKQAKELVKRHRAGDGVPSERLLAAGMRDRDAATPERVTLADAQFVVAREYGFTSWAHLKHYVESLPLLSMKEYDQLAADLAKAHRSGDTGAVREVNKSTGRRSSRIFTIH